MRQYIDVVEGIKISDIISASDHFASHGYIGDGYRLKFEVGTLAC